MSDPKLNVKTGPSVHPDADVPLIYADKIVGIEFGPGVSKIRLGFDGGRDVALLILPTLGLIETIENMYPLIKSPTGMVDVIGNQLDVLKSKLGSSNS